MASGVYRVQLAAPHWLILIGWCPRREFWTHLVGPWRLESQKEVPIQYLGVKGLTLHIVQRSHPYGKWRFQWKRSVSMENGSLYRKGQFLWQMAVLWNRAVFQSRTSANPLPFHQRKRATFSRAFVSFRIALGRLRHLYSNWAIFQMLSVTLHNTFKILNNFYSWVCVAFLCHMSLKICATAPFFPLASLATAELSPVFPLALISMVSLKSSALEYGPVYTFLAATTAITY